MYNTALISGFAKLFSGMLTFAGFWFSYLILHEYKSICYTNNKKPFVKPLHSYSCCVFILYKILIALNIRTGTSIIIITVIVVSNLVNNYVQEYLKMELQGESFKKLLDLANAYRESQEENNNLKEKIHQLEERMKELEKKEKRKMLFHSLANRSNTVLADETQSQSDIKGQSYKMYFPL